MIRVNRVRCAASSAVTVVVLLACGCASSQPRSSVMTAEDYQDIAVEVGAKLSDSLASDPLFADRTSESPPMVIAVQKVLNLSSDILSAGARWYLMERMVSSSGIRRLRKEKNLVFVIPAERLREAKRVGVVDDEAGADRRPTHVLRATLRSVSRVGKEARTDIYFCEFEMTNLQDGELLWSGEHEFKRVASGLLIN